jgi:hypothetical protein
MRTRVQLALAVLLVAIVGMIGLWIARPERTPPFDNLGPVKRIVVGLAREKFANSPFVPTDDCMDFE